VTSLPPPPADEPPSAFGLRVESPQAASAAASEQRNVSNFALLLLVPLPALGFAILLFGWFPPNSIPDDPGLSWPSSVDEGAALLIHHPILAANLAFLVFVDLQFWAIALVQRSSWLIDPYWTLIPPLLALFFLAHPLADPEPVRAWLAGSLLLVWSARLTFNYFRREQWQFGAREDWRYAKMRLERRHFWLEQALVVFAAQHLMLIGLCLPIWAIAFRDAPLGVLDGTFAMLAAAGIAIARAADDQLERFMSQNRERRLRREPAIPVLDTGIWRFSRHPNYFGEQLFWWSLAGFGVVCGEPWVAIGSLFNSIVLAAVTVMTERRMLSVPERSEAFLAYRRRTSVWIPWPPRPDTQGAET
jgi:steroid 5-alpha reductase family enzyme